MSDSSAAPRQRSDSGGSRRFYVWFAAAALVVAGLLALFASASPDGLERVADDTGFAETAQDSPVAGSPIADYQVGGEDAEGAPWQRSLAGVAGVAIMAGVGLAVFGALARRRAPTVSDPAPRAGRVDPSRGV